MGFKANERLIISQLHPLLLFRSTTSRISDIEIAGSNRKKMNNKQKNKPSDPSNVAQSKNVGEYVPHDDGKNPAVNW